MCRLLGALTPHGPRLNRAPVGHRACDATTDFAQSLPGGALSQLRLHFYEGLELPDRPLCLNCETDWHLKAGVKEQQLDTERCAFNY